MNIFAMGQCDTNRYVNPIFQSVYKHSNVKYGEAPVWNIPYNNTDLYMDIYEPNGDVLTKRPLMLWVHPGGFLLGDKEVDDMVALCDSFAKRGYVTASIGYRLGFNPLSSSSAERAVYRGTQDVRAAIRYLMEYSDIYDIDTNYIFLGGSSAGAVATVHVVYADQDEVPTSVTGGFFDPDLGCLDCTGNAYVHDVSVAGFVNLWGALGDSSWIDSDETTPGLLIHGVDDDVVPFGVGHPFGVITTPLTDGSRSIHNQLDFHGINHGFIPFAGQGHEPHGTSNGTFNGPPTPYWDTIFNAVRDHYFTILQPDAANISGDEVVCDTDSVWYSVNIGSNETVCWGVTNGVILQTLNDAILVEWSQGTGSVTARVKNEVDAVSNETSLAITINELPSNTFTFSANGGIVAFDLSSPEIANVDWDFGDLSAASGQVVEHTYTQNGTYEVNAVITGANGCVNYSTQSITINVSELLNIEGQNVISLFPNPTRDKLTLANVPNGAEVIVTDAIGNKLMTKKITEPKTTFDVQHFEKGVYFVTVLSDGNYQTKRFVKN